MSIVMTKELAKQAKALIKNNKDSVYLISDDNFGVWLVVYGTSTRYWGKHSAAPVLLKLGVDESLPYPLQTNLSQQYHGTTDFKTVLQKIVKAGDAVSVRFEFEERIEGFDQKGSILFSAHEEGIKFATKTDFLSLNEDGWHYKEYVAPVKITLQKQQERTEIGVCSKSLKTMFDVLHKVVVSKDSNYPYVFCQAQNGVLTMYGTDGYTLLRLETACTAPTTELFEFCFGAAALPTMKAAITGDTAVIGVSKGSGVIGDKTFQTYEVVSDGIEQEGIRYTKRFDFASFKEQTLSLMSDCLTNPKGWFSIKTVELTKALKLCHVFDSTRLIFDTVGLHTEERSKGGCSYKLTMEGDVPTKAFCIDKSIEQMLKMCDKKGEAVLGYTTTDEFPNWLLKQAINEVYITGVFARCVPDEVKESNDENGEEYSDECGYEGSVEKSDIAAVEGVSC